MKITALIALGLLAAFLSEAEAQDAKEILDASGVKGGLIVVIGCDSPALPAELWAGNSYLVHGLDRDAGKVDDARKYLQAKGLYGSITAARWEGSQLPYVDNLVNVIIVAGDTGQISKDEMTRVLAPLGVIADVRKERIEITRKPWSAELDEWTHYLYDASNNAVSNDRVVGPPLGLRWTCGPEYGRSHEHFAGVSAMVTAGGRIFYIIDEGPISSVYLPPQWKLVVRDAFSGVLLWKRQFKALGEVAPATVAVDDGRLCLQSVSHVVCLVLSFDRAAKGNVDKSPPAQGSKWLVSSGGFEDRQAGELVTFALDDGRELWRAPYSENYNTPGDVFVIDGVVWVGNLRAGADPGFTQGRDLKTGKITATLPPQKAWGHHRCYRNKATVRWMLVGRGGVQFIDPWNGTVKGHSWVRGTCQYGIMPANGLVYAPQHSCACQPEELLIGFNALSPRSSAGKGVEPLEKGPAYDEITNLQPSSSKTTWPTYRRDVHRSGYQDLPAPGKPSVAWTSKLSAPITAPVAAGGLVLVAETDRHCLHALSAVDGEPTWTFVADGRIDSPPTLSGGLCLFGTRNGFVYCLRAWDGALVWRFRAAPQDRRLFAYEQLESVWPVHGSVLVNDKLSGGAATYFAAGRSSRIDGGICLYALELKTGEVLHKADVSMTAGAAGANGADIIRQAVLPDILSAQKDTIWMRGMGVDKNLAPVKDLPHLFAPRGFLDDTWWHRTYWVYGTEIGGGYSHWPLVGNRSPAGRLLVFDGGKLIYGYGRMAYRAGAGHVRPDIVKDYRLFAEVLDPPRAATRDEESKRRIKWTAQLPFVARSIVLTRDALLVAGGKSPTESAVSHGPGTFWVASRQDGSIKGTCALPAPPVLDGMALTDSGTFVSTINGSLVCLRTKNDK